MLDGLAAIAARNAVPADPAARIRDGILILRDLSRVEMMSGSQRRPLVEARQEIAFRVWTEVEASTLSQIARLIGRRDHSAAIHAILAGARANGVQASRVTDLRQRTDPVDWTKLAYAAAGWRAARDLTQERAARQAGIGRGEWRKVERGQSVSAGAMLRVCRHIGLDPLTLISHETAVKHEGDDGA